MVVKNDFLLSVVATTRNDNHGKNLNYRMQHFVDGFIAQCKKHDLKAELILVEWNPPDDTLPLAQALKFPADKGPCTIRIIRVPKTVHQTIPNSEKLPLYQMIGKNVGIRRAKGKYVLATNIDILFSDNLIKFLKKKLKPNRLYRVDRLDVPEKLPEVDSIDTILQFCHKNYFRVNGKFGTTCIQRPSFKHDFFEACKIALLHKEQRKKTLNKLIAFCRKDSVIITIPYKSFKLFVNFFIFLLKKRIIDFFIRPIPFLVRHLKNTSNSLVKEAMRLSKSICEIVLFNKTLFLHTNACGDFTLLSLDKWYQLRGYPEWPYYSWHLDSVLLYQAKQHGIREHDLSPSMSIYHIEHEIGSGYSPEGAQKLFDRLNEKQIPYLDNKGLSNIVHELNTSKEKTVYNTEDWGLAVYDLEEVIV